MTLRMPGILRCAVARDLLAAHVRSRSPTDWLAYTDHRRGCQACKRSLDNLKNYAAVADQPEWTDELDALAAEWAGQSGENP